MKFRDITIFLILVSIFWPQNLLSTPTGAKTVDITEYLDATQGNVLVHNKTGETGYAHIVEEEDKKILYYDYEEESYQKFLYTDEYIKLLEGTDWLIGPNQETKCSDTGNKALYKVYNQEDTTCSNIPEQVGAPWSKKVMTTDPNIPNHSYTQTISLVGFDSQEGDCCETSAEITTEQRVTLRYKGCVKMPDGIKSENSIVLSVGGATGGYARNYYLDDGIGLIGTDIGGGGNGMYISEWEGDDVDESVDCWEVEQAMPTYNDLPDFNLSYAEEHGQREPDQAHFYIPLGPNKDKVTAAEQAVSDVPSLRPLTGSGPSSGWMPGVWTGEVPDFSTEQLKAVKRASGTTGVRASLILATMNRESGFNSESGTKVFAGTGNYCKTLCGPDTTDRCPDCKSCSSVGNSIATYISTIQCRNFDKTWAESGDWVVNNSSLWFKNNVPTSPALIYKGKKHHGGAMGAAQAMPEQWQERIRNIRKYSDIDNPSPWRVDDALIFAGLHLKAAHTWAETQECKQSGGAATKACFAESCAGWAYVGAHSDNAKQRVALANAIADKYDELEEDWCTGWSKEGEGDWKLPVLDGLSQGFVRGTPTSWGHHGWDFCSGVGTPVKSTDSGAIISEKTGCGVSENFGCMIKTIHEIDGTTWKVIYAHLGNPYSQSCFNGNTDCYDPNGIRKNAGHVEKGEVIGNTNDTGNSSGPHLHFEIRREGEYIDPRNKLEFPGMDPNCI